MLEREQKRVAGAKQTGVASLNPYSRRMLLALILLLVALGAVVAKNSEIWFGSDETADAQDAGPAWVPSHTSYVAPAAQPTVPAAAPAPVKKHAVAKASSKPSNDSMAVVTNRAVLPPLAIEVVAGDNHRTVGTVSNSLKVEIPSSEVNAAASTTSEWGPATKASQRERMSEDQPRVRPTEVSYPLLARQMKVQGAVLLQALINADGVIENLRVLSGPPILASAAREAALQWRFKPYLQDGRPVETQATITVNFTIKVLDNGAREEFTPVASLNGQS